MEKNNGITMPISEINKCMRGLLEVVAQLEGSRFLSITTTLSKRPSGNGEVAVCRDNVVYTAIYTATDYLCEAGLSVAYALEAVDQDLSRIDVDVERIGRALHRDLSFVYLTRGNVVHLPYTVPKGSSAELEIADLIAYWVNRYFQRHYVGKEQHIDLSTFGAAHWTEIRANGCVVHPAIGYPFDIGEI